MAIFWATIIILVILIAFALGSTVYRDLAGIKGDVMIQKIDNDTNLGEFRKVSDLKAESYGQDFSEKIESIKIFFSKIVNDKEYCSLELKRGKFRISVDGKHFFTERGGKWVEFATEDYTFDETLLPAEESDSLREILFLEKVYNKLKGECK